MRTFLTLMLAGLAIGWVPALAQTGTITGTVRVTGVVPAPHWLKVTKNREVCGDSLRARDVVVKDQKLANAVITVEGLTGEAVPAERRLTNSACQFDPPVIAVAAGSALVVDNADDVLHNTHLNLRYGERARTVGNWGLSQKGMSVRSDRALRQAGIIDVLCDAHPWMSATIYAFAHPYFAVSDPSGGFTITGVPAGTHQIKLTHPVLGELEQSVTVAAGGTATVAFAIPGPKVAGKGAAP